MRSPRIVLCALLAWAGAAFAAVDANTASADALQSVRGVGPTIAQRIVEERRRGPYASLDDLQARVRGVGEASVRRMAAAGLSVGAGARPQVAGGIGRVHEVVPARGAAARPRAEGGRARDDGAVPRRTVQAPAPGAPVR